MDSESIGNRITKIIAGVFLFFFGLPFTLVPFMILGDIRGMAAGLFEIIFLLSRTFIAATGLNVIIL